MGTVFNKKELLVLLQDFHCLTGLRSAVFDSYGLNQKNSWKNDS